MKTIGNDNKSKSAARLREERRQRRKERRRRERETLPSSNAASSSSSPSLAGEDITGHVATSVSSSTSSPSSKNTAHHSKGVAASGSSSSSSSSASSAPLSSLSKPSTTRGQKRRKGDNKWPSVTDRRKIPAKIGKARSPTTEIPSSLDTQSQRHREAQTYLCSYGPGDAARRAGKVGFVRRSHHFTKSPFVVLRAPSRSFIHPSVRTLLPISSLLFVLSR